MSTTAKTFNLSLPIALVEKLDTKAREEYTSRSDIMRMAVLKYLREDKRDKLRELKKLLSDGQKIGANGKQISYERLAEMVSQSRI